MIYLAILRKIWPYLALVALVGGVWVWLQQHSTARFEAGKAEVMALWQEADKIALAVGNETTKLLKRVNATNEGVLNAKLKRIEEKVTRNAVELADDLLTIGGLRDELERRAAAPPSSDSAGATCGGHETKLGKCEGLLARSLEVAAGARQLVDRAENLLEQTDAALVAAQEWARLVQSAGEAP